MSFNRYMGDQDFDYTQELDRLNQKKKLKEYYKQIKAGMITLDDVPAEYKPLLMKYYGVY